MFITGAVEVEYTETETQGGKLMKKQVFNPYLPGYEYIPDGEPRVFGDRIYVYGSHDAFGGDNFCVNDYVLYSAPLDDLSSWRNDGVIYRKTQDPANRDGRMSMCAPDCVMGVDGRYYLYYQLHAKQYTSVAVASAPEGPFEYYGNVQHPDGTPWGEKKGDSFIFDPGVLVDDDGRVYLYAGFAPTGLFKKILKMRGNRVEESVCLELEGDMKTVKGGEKPVAPGPDKAKGTPFDGHAFFEASSIRKINGRYYYVYSSILSHELCWAVSSCPDRDFSFGGTLISNGDIGYGGRTEADNYTGNTHGGMAQINGEWYIFYHRQTNRQKCCRQGAAEKLTFLSDGSIAQSEMTSCGLNGGPLEGSGRYPTRIACTLSSVAGTFPYLRVREKDRKNIHPYFTQSGTDREKDDDQYIANMKSGSTAGFRYFSFTKPFRLSVRVRGNAEGRVDVRKEENGGVIMSIPVKPSSSWTEYEEKESIHLDGGYPLFFTFTGNGALDFESFEIMTE